MKDAERQELQEKSKAQLARSKQAAEEANEARKIATQKAKVAKEEADKAAKALRRSEGIVKSTREQFIEFTRHVAEREGRVLGVDFLSGFAGLALSGVWNIATDALTAPKPGQMPGWNARNKRWLWQGLVPIALGGTAYGVALYRRRGTLPSFGNEILAQTGRTFAMGGTYQIGSYGFDQFMSTRRQLVAAQQQQLPAKPPAQPPAQPQPPIR